MGEVFQGQVAEGTVHIVDGLDQGLPGARRYDLIAGDGSKIGQGKPPQGPG